MYIQASYLLVFPDLRQLHLLDIRPLEYFQDRQVGSDFFQIGRMRSYCQQVGILSELCNCVLASYSTQRSVGSPWPLSFLFHPKIHFATRATIREAYRCCYEITHSWLGSQRRQLIL